MDSYEVLLRVEFPLCRNPTEQPQNFLEMKMTNPLLSEFVKFPDGAR